MMSEELEPAASASMDDARFDAIKFCHFWFKIKTDFSFFSTGLNWIGHLSTHNSIYLVKIVPELKFEIKISNYHYFYSANKQTRLHVLT